LIPPVEINLCNFIDIEEMVVNSISAKVLMHQPSPKTKYKRYYKFPKPISCILAGNWIRLIAKYNLTAVGRLSVPASPSVVRPAELKIIEYLAQNYTPKLSSIDARRTLNPLQYVPVEKQ
jgi:hypothetical protein